MPERPPGSVDSVPVSFQFYTHLLPWLPQHQTRHLSHQSAPEASSVRPSLHLRLWWQPPLGNSVRLWTWSLSEGSTAKLTIVGYFAKAQITICIRDSKLLVLVCWIEVPGLLLGFGRPSTRLCVQQPASRQHTIPDPTNRWRQQIRTLSQLSSVSLFTTHLPGAPTHHGIEYGHNSMTV